MSDTSSPYSSEVVRHGHDRGQVDDRVTKPAAGRRSAPGGTPPGTRVGELHLEAPNAQAAIHN